MGEYKLATNLKYHGNILSLSENIAKSFFLEGGYFFYFLLTL